MGAAKGNKHAVGNKGGGRKGYEFEKDQLKKMQSHVNWLFAYVDSVRKGKSTESMDKKFQLLERVFLKEMDKLHANKNQNEVSAADGLPFVINIMKKDEPEQPSNN